jgi:hypothetical protein
VPRMCLRVLAVMLLVPAGGNVGTSEGRAVSCTYDMPSLLSAERHATNTRPKCRPSSATLRQAAVCDRPAT